MNLIKSSLVTAGLITSVFASTAFAAGSAEGTITEITSHTNYTNVFLDVDPTGSPGCSTKSFMSLSPENKIRKRKIVYRFDLLPGPIVSGDFCIHTKSDKCYF